MAYERVFTMLGRLAQAQLALECAQRAGFQPLIRNIGVPRSCRVRAARFPNAVG